MPTYAILAIVSVAALLLAFGSKLPIIPRRIRWGLPIILLALAGSLHAAFKPSVETATAPQQASLPPPLIQSTAMPDRPSHTVNKSGDLKAMAQRLASKLEQDPSNGQGWMLLAHTYMELRQTGAAEAAFAKAAQHLPADAKLLADWADLHVTSQAGKWDEQAGNLVKRALSIDPKNLKALALAGSEAFARSDYKQAIGYWKQMQAAAPDNSMHAKLALVNIQEAEARMAAGRIKP